MSNCFIPDDLIVTDVSCDSWQEAVQVAGKALLDKGLIEPFYIDKMIDVVKEFGPYMILVPKLCLFHGPPGNGVKEQCVSLITLKEPVYFKEFEGEEITCALALGAVDTESHLGILKNISTLLSDDSFLELVTNNGSKDLIIAKMKELLG